MGFKCGMDKGGGGPMPINRPKHRPFFRYSPFTPAHSANSSFGRNHGLRAR